MKKSPKSLKRETYCLSDGLWRAPLLRGTQPASTTALPASPAQASRPETSGMPPASCPSLPAETSAAQPPNQAGAQKKVASKLPPPRTSSLRGKSLHSAMEKVAPPQPHQHFYLRIRCCLASAPCGFMPWNRPLWGEPGNVLLGGRALRCRRGMFRRSYVRGVGSQAGVAWAGLRPYCGNSRIPPLPFRLRSSLSFCYSTGHSPSPTSPSPPLGILGALTSSFFP